ncbi:MAG: aspartate/glutamate racemase family protein [Ignavibacteria bacterium]|nr:aspartate/glutamate racemase family protein [Ignavibacteria bacterium]
MQNAKILLAAIFLTLLPVQAGNISDVIVKTLQNKENVKILVTDSGLGGLSVAAEIDSILVANHIFQNAEVIFFNALPDAAFRYNSLPDVAAKAKVFSSSLDAMEQGYKPDIILIACNTLSVVYPYTEFARKSTIPVVGIVEMGVSAVKDSLERHPEAKALILGTETTISSDAHKQGLVAAKIDAGRIMTEACPNLETEIQANPESDIVSNLIDFYLDELTDKGAKKEDKVYAALCCTHYGYAAASFARKLNSMFETVCLVNPNRIMAAAFTKFDAGKFPRGSVRCTVVSQAELASDEINSIGKLIKTVSPEAAKQLENYKKISWKY